MSNTPTAMDGHRAGCTKLAFATNSSAQLSCSDVHCSLLLTVKYLHLTPVFAAVASSRLGKVVLVCMPDQIPGCDHLHCGASSLFST